MKRIMVFCLSMFLFYSVALAADKYETRTSTADSQVLYGTSDNGTTITRIKVDSDGTVVTSGAGFTNGTDISTANITVNDTISTPSGIDLNIIPGSGVMNVSGDITVGNLTANEAFDPTNVKNSLYTPLNNGDLFRSIVKNNGTYYMYNEQEVTSVWGIYYRTSTDGYNWSARSDAVLAAGGVGTYDETGQADPSVIYNGTNDWQMWFDARNGTSVWYGLGYATSINGTNWTAYGSNPVITIGGAGTWDSNFIHHPCVIKDNGTYYMYYAGANATTSIYKVGLATSSDGITWTKYANNPIFSPDNITYNQYRPGHPFKKGNTWYMYLWSNNKTTGLDYSQYATSSDLYNWTIGGVGIAPGDLGTFQTNGTQANQFLSDTDGDKLYSVNSNATDTKFNSVSVFPQKYPQVEIIGVQPQGIFFGSDSESLQQDPENFQYDESTGVLKSPKIIVNNLTYDSRTRDNYIKINDNTFFVDNSGNFTNTVSDAPAGSVIYLESGTYSLSANIAVNKALSIIGAGIDKTILSMTADSSKPLLITADNVLVRDLTINNTGSATCYAVSVEGTAGDVFNNVNLENLKFNLNGAGTKVGINYLEAGGYLNNIIGSVTSSDGIAWGIYTKNQATAEAVTNLYVTNTNITTSAGATSSYVYQAQESAAANNINLYLYDCVGVALEGSASSSSAVYGSGDNSIINVYGGYFSGVDNDIQQASSATVNVYNTNLVNGKATGTITYLGTNYGAINTTSFVANCNLSMPKSGIAAPAGANKDLNGTVSVIGTNTTLMGLPATFVNMTVNGTAYKIPAY